MQWIFVEHTDTLISASQINTICASRVEDENAPRAQGGNSVGRIELIHYGINAIPEDSNWRVDINHRDGCYTWIDKITRYKANSKVREIVRAIAETNDNIVLAKDGSVSSFQCLYGGDQPNESTKNPTTAQSQKPAASISQKEHLR